MVKQGIGQKVSHHTVMYQIWMKPGSEAILERVWCHQKEELNELGVVESWVRVHDEGLCEAFLVWQSQSHWKEANQFCNLLEVVLQQLDQAVLGWFSPVTVVARHES